MRLRQLAFYFRRIPVKERQFLAASRAESVLAFDFRYIPVNERQFH